MNVTEIFQALAKAEVIKYEGDKYWRLLRAFAPELIEQYLIPNHPKVVVYVWRDRHNVIYVGQSRSWHNRLYAHLCEMLSQKCEMYKQFHRAHEAGTLTVELIPCENKDLDTLEAKTIAALSNPCMYNVEHNPNQPKPRRTPLFSTIEQLHTMLEETWINDPLYLSMKDRLTATGHKTPTGTCLHCSKTFTFRKLVNHEDGCIFKISEEERAGLKLNYDTAPNKAKFLTAMATKYGISQARIKEACVVLPAPTVEQRREHKRASEDMLLNAAKKYFKNHAD